MSLIMLQHNTESRTIKRASVAFIMATDTRRFLAQCRASKYEIDMRSKWGLFGGEAEDHDTPEQALVREVEEETGLLIKNESYLVKIAEQETPAGSLSSLFLVCVQHEFAPILCDESAGYKWTTLDDWPQPGHFMMQRSIDALKDYSNRTLNDNYPAMPVRLG
jgi:8-oxo-dGTP pyrophosphatase MutT (NUDIX family)